MTSPTACVPLFQRSSAAVNRVFMLFFLVCTVVKEDIGGQPSGSSAEGMRPAPASFDAFLVRTTTGVFVAS